MAFVMELLGRVKDGIIQLMEAFFASAPACVYFTLITAFASVYLMRFLAGGLLEMHRSRTNIKKIKNSYGFWQKLMMQHVWKECLHAKTFCRWVILWHHMRIVLLVGILLLVVISNWMPQLLRISGYSCVFVFLLLDIPVLIMSCLLDRYPFRKMKYEFRFRKYHNTEDHDSLF